MTNPADIKICLIPLEEWPQYRALRLEAVQNEPQAYLDTYEKVSKAPDSKWQSRLENSFKVNGSLLVFAKDGDMLIGMAGCHWEDSPENDKATVIAVYLNKNYRGQGIGRNLMEALIERIKQETEFRKLELEVNAEQGNAFKLYEKLGFIRTGSQRLKLGDGNEYEVVAMEKFI